MSSDNKASSVWSPEEDRELARLQEKFGNRWALVAAELEGKTGQQCAQRWRHKVNPNIRKEKWSEEEDKKLSDMYARYGQRWAEIARHLEGRTDQQCMGRWRRHLDPSVKKDAWATAEDAHLHELHDTLGPKWSLISKALNGRTAQQCRARWFQLQSPSTPSTPNGENTFDVSDTEPIMVREEAAVLSSIAATSASAPAPFTPPMSPTTPTQSEECEPPTATATATATAMGGAAAAKPRRPSSPTCHNAPQKPRRPSSLKPHQPPSAPELQPPPQRRRLHSPDSDVSTASAAPAPLRVVKGGVEKKRGATSGLSGGVEKKRRKLGEGSKTEESGGIDMLSMLYSVAITFDHEAAKFDAVFSRGMVA